MEKHIAAQGVKLMDASRGVASEGFWFFDSYGVPIAIIIAAKTAPDVPPYEVVSCPRESQVPRRAQKLIRCAQPGFPKYFFSHRTFLRH